MNDPLPTVLVPPPPFSPAPPAPSPAPKPVKKRRWWLWGLVLLGLPCLGSLVLVISVAVISRPSVPDQSVLVMKIGGELKDRASDEGLADLFGSTPLTLPDHLFNLRKAAVDKRISGVLLELEMPAFGYAKVEELREALIEFRKSGKFVVAYSEFYFDKSYALALGADEIVAPPGAPFFFHGLAAEVIHYPGLLEKLGIEVQYFRYGKYKSVSGESMGRKELTEPVKEMINHTLDVEYGLFLDGVAQARKLDREQVKALVDEGGLRAEWAQEHKLLDTISYRDELDDKLRKKLGVAEDKKLPQVAARAYRKVSGSQAGLKDGKETFALIFSQGLVVAGQGGGTSPLGGGEDTQGSLPIIKALRKAVEDDDVKAIIFRVDSPGGSGMGCDFVRREIELAVKKKPVVVSMSDMAASGGYWVSMNATAIVAEPSTYTGSIGIWSVVPNLKGTYEKLGLNQEVFTRGAHADALSSNRPMTPEEAKAFDQALKDSYDRFVSLAALGRHMPQPEMAEIAQGRTWLGQDALDKKLVDKLGGLWTAVALAKSKVGIPESDLVKLKPFEAHRSPWQHLLNPDDDDEDESPLDLALAASLRRSGLAQTFAPAARLLVVGREILLKHETLFLMPEYGVEIH